MGAKVSTIEELQKAAKSLAEGSVRIQAAFLPLQQSLLALAEAFALAFAPMSYLSIELELEAARAAREEIDRQAMMARVTSLTWRVVWAIVAARVAWLVWL